MGARAVKFVPATCFVGWLTFIVLDYVDEVGVSSKCSNCLIKFNQTFQSSLLEMDLNVMKLILTFVVTLLCTIALEPKKKEKSIYLVQVLDHKEDDNHSIDEAQEKPLPENDAAVMAQ